MDKLDEEIGSQLYLFHFFLSPLSKIFVTSYTKNRCIRLIVDAVKQDRTSTLEKLLLAEYWHYPEDWRKEFQKELPNSFQEEDDIPF